LVTSTASQEPDILKALVIWPNTSCNWVCSRPKRQKPYFSFHSTVCKNDTLPAFILQSHHMGPVGTTQNRIIKTRWAIETMSQGF